MALKFYADEKTKLATIVRTGIGTETLKVSKSWTQAWLTLRRKSMCPK